MRKKKTKDICPICGRRKGKRLCTDYNQKICSQCCGPRKTRERCTIDHCDYGLDLEKIKLNKFIEVLTKYIEIPFFHINDIEIPFIHGNMKYNGYCDLNKVSSIVTHTNNDFESLISSEFNRYSLTQLDVKYNNQISLVGKSNTYVFKKYVDGFVKALEKTESISWKDIISYVRTDKPFPIILKSSSYFYIISPITIHPWGDNRKKDWSCKKYHP